MLPDGGSPGTTSTCQDDQVREMSAWSVQHWAVLHRRCGDGEGSISPVCTYLGHVILAGVDLLNRLAVQIFQDGRVCLILTGC